MFMSDRTRAPGTGGRATSVPRACTTCGISAPAHDEAIAVGVVRAHAWTGSTDPRPTTGPTASPTDEKEARP